MKRLQFPALTIVLAMLSGFQAHSKKAHKNFYEWYAYEGPSMSASDLSNPTNYIRSFATGGSGSWVAAIYASETTYYGYYPQIPVGFGTAIAAYTNDGTNSVSVTEVDGVTVTFTTP